MRRITFSMRIPTHDFRFFSYTVRQTSVNSWKVSVALVDHGLQIVTVFEFISAEILRFKNFVQFFLHFWKTSETDHYSGYRAGCRIRRS